MLLSITSGRHFDTLCFPLPSLQNWVLFNTVGDRSLLLPVCPCHNHSGVFFVCQTPLQLEEAIGTISGKEM